MPKAAIEIHSAFRVTPQIYEETHQGCCPPRASRSSSKRIAQSGVFVGRSAYIRDPDGNVIEFIDLKRAPATPT